jgi:DNA-binding NarL/FixJ family response regulator
MEQFVINMESVNPESIMLTRREKEVLFHICLGDTNIEIGAKLQLSHKTIEIYKSRLLAKTKTRNSAHLVLFAMVNKLVDFECKHMVLPVFEELSC